MFKHFLKPTQNYIFITVIILLNFEVYEFNSNVNQRYYANATTSNQFRFRDFEPRYVIKTDAEITPKLFDNLVRNTPRKSRGFQFHADDRDINIDLEFIVPFVRIPIERSMAVTKTAFRNLFNLNFQSLLTTGAIVAVGGIFAIILKALYTPFVQISDFKKNSRLDNGEVSNILNSINYKTYAENSTDSQPNISLFATFMESELLKNNINISHCIQKSICNYVQKALRDVRSINGAAGGLPKIIDGVISLDLVHDYLSGTAIQHALDTAKDGQSCDLIFQDCNWSFHTKKILKFLSKKISYLNIT